MKFENASFYAEVSRRVLLALQDVGVVNVAAIAQSLRRIHASESIYDIESAVLGYATLIGAPILFERLLSGEIERPIGEDNSGLLLEVVLGDPDALPN